MAELGVKDGTGKSLNPYNKLSNSPLGVYENVALYLEDDQGKIGLIDLEEFTTELVSKRQKDWSAVFKCQQAVDLFPYHFNEILEIAKKFDGDIEKHRQFLETERDEALKRFKLAYEDHLVFIKQNKITFENPLKLVEITPTRKDEIKKAIELIIHNAHNDKYKYLETPQEVVALFEKSFPKILNLTTEFLSDKLKFKINSTKNGISSYSQLLSFRTLFFNLSELQEKVSSELEIRFENEWDKKDLASLIIQSIFEALEGTEIAYYNPQFGYGGHVKHCIFC